MTTKYSRSILFTIVATLLTTVAYSVPALKGTWRYAKLDDGNMIRLYLQGDEYGHYWTDSLGVCYQITDSKAKVIDKNSILQVATLKRKKANEERSLRLNAARKAAKVGQVRGSYFGKKKGLIILAQFSDKSFKSGHTRSYFDDIANKLNYSNTIGFVGSVKDYFLAQSNNQFELDFDVVGPYTLNHPYAYYGENDDNGNDKRPGAMVAEALRLADDDVDYSLYDWDGNGYVEQVFVLYAGLGEAAGGDENTIWPHEYKLSYSDYGSSYVTKEGTVVNTYACGSEQTITSTVLGKRERIDGIGTICHEFSHCLGYPDLYDTSYSGNFGMGYYDLMSSGSYNGNSFCPPNFSAYEKWFAGWIEPTVLDKPATIKGLQPQGVNYGQTFIIYNDAHPDEYYLLENRQQSGNIWDSKLAASGLMILHVDYDANIWSLNKVNAIVNYSDTYGDAYKIYDNDHERLTIFHADNTNKKEEGDLYPYNGNNSLTESSTPSDKIYNNGTSMGKPITNIVQNEDGTIDFDFMGGSENNIISGIDKIKEQTRATSFNKIYTIDGRYVGNSIQLLEHGIYIRNGKKIIK